MLVLGMRLFSVASLTITIAVAASVTNVIPPASKGTWIHPSESVVFHDALTDAETIVNTVVLINQKTGASGTPNHPVSQTAVTAIDGRVLAKPLLSSPSVLTRSLDALTHSVGEYELVFRGTGVGPDARDAAIEGTAYLTFTLIPNSTYNVAACLNFCSNIKGCVFANLYYEFNNDALDHRESSNLKCAAYGDTHTAAEKTNWGGQQLEPPPAGLTYIQESTGWSSKVLVDPDVPDGYELVFGPTNGANNARGYMGFVLLDRYDVVACARECSKRDSDPVGGACHYFNIWRAVVNGVPTSYTCSMYFLVTDASTATNTGQGSLKVTFSRGYKRKNYVIDGGFEGYTACKFFCFQASYANWIGTSSPQGDLDATVFFFQHYAHFGQAVGLLGSVTGADDLPGTLSPAKPLQTLPGKRYIIGFFQASTFSGPTPEAASFVQVVWNENVVKTIRPGYSDWQYYAVEVVGQGNDLLAFHGGSAPAWSFVDDICVFLDA